MRTPPAWMVLAAVLVITVTTADTCGGGGSSGNATTSSPSGQYDSEVNAVCAVGGVAAATAIERLQGRLKFLAAAASAAGFTQCSNAIDDLIDTGQTSSPPANNVIQNLANRAVCEQQGYSRVWCALLYPL